MDFAIQATLMPFSRSGARVSSRYSRKGLQSDWGE